MFRMSPTLLDRLRRIRKYLAGKDEGISGRRIDRGQVKELTPAQALSMKLGFKPSQRDPFGDNNGKRRRRKK